MATNSIAGGGSPNKGLVVGGAVLIGIFALGTFNTRNPDFDLFFGVEGYRLLGVPVFVVCAAALLVVLLTPGVADSVARSLAAAVSRLPVRLRLPLLLASTGAVFFSLTNYNLSGDAGAVLQRLSLERIYPSNALTNWIFQFLFTLGLDPREAIRVTSCLAGVLFAFAAWGIGQVAFPDGPRRAGVTGLLLTSGTAGLFFGTVEVYPLMVAGCTLYLWLGLRWLNGRGSGLWPPLCLGVVFWLHMSAGLLLPSLGLLANRGRFWPIDFRRWFRWGLLFLIPVALLFLCLFLFTWDGVPPEAKPDRYGTLFGAGEDGMGLPFSHSPFKPTQRYAVFDVEHIVGVLNLFLLVAPAGLLLIFIGRRAWRAPEFRFISAAALTLTLFPFFWNISYEIRRDWDLFSGMGVPLTILGAFSYFAIATRRRQVARALAVSAFCFLPMVLSNHLDPGYRSQYAYVLASQIRETVTDSACRAAARLACPASDSLRREREVERMCKAALQHAGTFDVPGPAIDEGCFRRELETALAGIDLPRGLRIDVRRWAQLVTEEAQVLASLIASGREPWPGTGMFAFVAADRALSTLREEGSIKSDADARALEPYLLDAVDEAVQEQDTFRVTEPRIEPRKWRETVLAEIAKLDDRESLVFDAGAIVDALAETLDIRRAEEKGLRWPGLLRTAARWEERSASFLPPGFRQAFHRAESIAGGDLERGEALARHLLERAPGDPSCFALLGAIVSMRGRTDEATGILREAIDRNPTNLHPRYHLAWILIWNEDPHGAMRCLETALSISGGGLDTQTPSLLILLAGLRHENGDLKLARALYEIALQRLFHTPGKVRQRDASIELAREALRTLPP